MLALMDCFNEDGDSVLRLGKNSIGGKKRLLLLRWQRYNLLEIWHVFIFMSGCLKSINVSKASPLYEKTFFRFDSLPFKYRVNVVVHISPFQICNTTYSEWPIFFETVMDPVTNERKLFSKMQYTTRKNINLAFGVPQYLRYIISTPARFGAADAEKKVVKCVAIIYGMIVGKRMFKTPLKKKQNTERIVVCNVHNPLWKCMMPLSVVTNASKTVGTLAGKCILEMF